MSNLIAKKDFKEKDRKVKYLMLEPTNYCNLDCMGCNRRDVIKTRPLEHMSIEDYSKILEKLEGQPIEEVKLQGLGETFFHPRIHDFFILFKEKFPDAKTITFTNGQYKLKKKNGENTSTGERFEKALSAIDVLLISCDGWDKNYTKYKFPGRWSVFLNFLDEVGTYEQIQSGETKVGLQMIVWEDNYKDIEKVFSLKEKYSWISEVRLNVFQWWGEDQSASSLSTVDLKGREISASYDFSEDFYKEMEKWRDNIAGKSEWNFSDCWWPNNGLFVESNGDVKMCLLNTDSSPSGNIINQSLSNVLSNKKRNLVSYECKTNSPGKHCETCSYKELVPVLKKIGI